MDLRRGILGGTTLLFAMTGAACPEDTSTNPGVTTDAAADMTADQTGGDSTAADSVAADTAATDATPDGVSTPDVAADTAVPDTAVADAEPDMTVVPDIGGSDGEADMTAQDSTSTPDGVVSDAGHGDTSVVDAAVDAAADVAIDAAIDVAQEVAQDIGADVCEEPDVNINEILGTACDSGNVFGAFYAICDPNDTTSTLAYCYGGGTWQAPTGPDDACASCVPIECGFDTATCAFAIGYVGIGVAGVERQPTLRLRMV